MDAIGFLTSQGVEFRFVLHDHRSEPAPHPSGYKLTLGWKVIRFIEKNHADNAMWGDWTGFDAQIHFEEVFHLNVEQLLRFAALDDKSPFLLREGVPTKGTKFP